MKRIFIFLIAFACFMANVNAQDILKFKGIPIIGKIDDFNKAMNEKNFISLGTVQARYEYLGLFYGRKVDAYVGFIPSSREVTGVDVIFPEEGDDAIKLYNGLLKHLENKYKTKNENLLGKDYWTDWNYGEKYGINLSIGEISHKVVLRYYNKEKDDEWLHYMFKNKECMSEHINDL